MPVTGSQPDRAVISGPAGASGRALRWPTWPGWQDAAWVALSLLGLAIDALLENAVQHTGPGDSIRLSVVRHGGDPAVAGLAVEDGGTGMTPVELDGIFGRFATASGSARRRGTGLGLSLVRAVAIGHGGEVRVQSTPAAGSRFEVLLPVRAGTTRPVPGPDLDRPDLDRPDLDRPDLDRPDLDRPDLGRTGLASTGLASTGLASTGAATMKGG